MIEKMLEKIKQAKSIVIIGHVTPDGDCLGCQFGLKEIIKDTFNKKEVYAIGEESQTLAYMGKLDTVSDKVVKESLVILVDLANMERAADKRYNTGVDLIKIDHHFNSEEVGSLCYVDCNVSACAEIIARIAIENDLVVSADAATSLLTGIITDSGGFRYTGVSNETFKITAFLLERGADIVELNKKIAMVSYNELKIKGYVIENMKVTDTGFAYCVITKKTMEEYHVIYEEASNAVNSLANIYGYPVWALILEKGSEYRIRLRSNGPRIDLLANKYGGGGHKLASGCRIYNLKEVYQFSADADEVVREYKRKEA
ncbi:MAG: bifunctional oligoribonuclease/PAP phosphatase NrnA [Acholeplasmatales bacterium]|nr:bifunctional oligoribonuclease/PAP phosphatase NrnA [Acholeplasmatales bacterium]